MYKRDLNNGEKVVMLGEGRLRGLDGPSPSADGCERKLAEAPFPLNHHIPIDDS